MQMQNVQTQQPQKKSLNFKESVAGYVAGNVASVASMPVGMSIANKMSKIATSLNPSEINSLNQAAETILDTTGLKKMGVNIIHKNTTKLPNKIAEFLDKDLSVAAGKNAFFSSSINSIFLNKQKLPTAAFHEIGHALNYNKSAFWRTMQNLRTPGILIGSSLMLFNVLTKKTKPKEGQELSKFQKIKNWVRDKSGFLAFGAMIPMLAEEAAASIKGCKEAKKILDPNLYKSVVKTNKIAYLTYLTTAVVAGLAAFITAKVKDKLVEKKEAKLQMTNVKAMHG